MTKNDIAVELCNRIPTLQKSTAIDIVDNLAGILSDAFARGENVYIRGFATLEVRTAKEKKARNIAAGSTIVIPARRTVKFKVSSRLKSIINKDA